MKNQLLENTTKLQQIASNPNNSIFVSASAGSGKTKVLTDRVLRLLLNGARPAKILCLTFTKVAAAEMQSRIYKELSNWAVLSDEELKTRLLSLSGTLPSSLEMNLARKLFAIVIDDFEGLKISTIHSFCESIIRKFPFEAKISPNFEVIDPALENQLLFDARKKLLEMAVNDLALSARIQEVTAILNEENFLDITAEILNKREKLAELKEYFFDINGVIEKIFQTLNCHQNQSEEQLFLEFYQDKNFNKKDLLMVCEAMIHGTPATDRKNSIAISNYIKTPSAENFENYQNVFLTDKNEARKTLITKEISKINADFQNILTAEQIRILNFIELLNSLKIAKSTSSLLYMVDKILEIYLDLKNKNGYLDYNDLIIKTGNLLNNSANADWIRYKLDGGTEHILVDESQDTNHYQWNIIKAITEDFFSGSGALNKNRTIFIVGDEKQSIYSFQGAEPEIFSNIFHYYQNKLGQIHQKIIDVELNSSFRSSQTILDVVDLVFSEEERRKAISKLKNQIQHFAVKNLPGKVELMPIININKEEKEDKNNYEWQFNFETDDEYKSQELLAQIIAKTIKKWFLENKIITEKNGIKRLIKPSDIMILLKNRTNNLGNLLIKNLSAENIPVSGTDKINLIKHIIIMDLIAAAKFILLPKDDLNLACLLKSPLIGVNEEELLRLCIAKNEQQISLIEAIKISENPKIQNVSNFLINLKEKYDREQNCIYNFFTYILEIKNGKETIIERFGSEASEIINQFLLLCLNYQDNHNLCLENFVNLLDEIDAEIKIDQNNQEFDIVRITTIHSAKGLEAPIVFLADTVHNAQSQYGGNDKSKIIWLEGENYDLPFWVQSEAKNNLIKQIKELNHINQQEEYLRALYVAMTRAESELYITGFGKATSSCWYNLIKNSLAEKYPSQIFDFNSLIGEEKKEYLVGEGIVVKSAESEDLRIERKSPLQPNEQFTLPQFAKEPIAKLEINQEIIYPSKIEEENRLNELSIGKINYGKIIHKILEILPNIKTENSAQKKSIIVKYLSQNQQILPHDQEFIISQIENILGNDELAYLFDEKNSKAEVQVIGEINGNLISGKIDRLVFKDNQIIVIDYKTGRYNTALKSYQKQLNLYKQVLQKLYPEKEIILAIIWTESGKITYLD